MEQRNPYKGDPPRSWVRVVFQKADGSGKITKILRVRSACPFCVNSNMAATKTIFDFDTNMPLDALYQEIILDHFKNPRNFGKLDGPLTAAHHENPSCGDQLDLQVVIDAQQRISQIKFYGRGCAISQASASMMTELVKAKTVAEARDAIASFKHMLTGEGEAKIVLGDLAALSGVKQFPVRVKCAMLAWKALESCLQPGATN